MNGGFVSCTVIVKVPVAVLPLVSDAEHVTVVEPKGNVEPDEGLHVTGRCPSMLSFAEAKNVKVAPDGPVAWIVMLLGRPRNGGAVSATVSAAHEFDVVHDIPFDADATIVVSPGAFACAFPPLSTPAADGFVLCHCTVGSEFDPPPLPTNAPPGAKVFTGGVLSASVVASSTVGLEPGTIPPIA
jgi:hypothetical protein